MTAAKKTAAKKTTAKKTTDEKPAAKKTAAKKKPGLYANIHAKQERIKNGSGEHMREPGSEGAPKKEDFDKSEKTAKHDTKKK